MLATPRDEIEFTYSNAEYSLAKRSFIKVVERMGGQRRLQGFFRQRRFLLCLTVLGQPLSSGLQAGAEAKRTAGRRDRQPTILTDQEDTVGVGAIGLVDFVVDIVDQARDRQFLFFEQHFGRDAAILEGLLLEYAFLFRVTHRTSAIDCMCFGDVDQAKLGDVLILLVHLLDGIDRCQERGSRVAAEDQHGGFLALEVREIECRIAV